MVQVAASGSSMASGFASGILEYFIASLQIAWLTPLLFKWAFPLSEVPGPFVAKLSRWWLWSKLSSGNPGKALENVNRGYGSLVRIGPNHVLVDDPETIKRILSRGSTYRKGPWFDTLKTNPNNGNLVSERDPEKHSHIRKIFNTGIMDYGMSNVEAVINKHISQWMIAIKRRIAAPNSTRQLDLSQQISFLTVDIMTEISLGRSFECIRLDEDRHGLLQTIRSGMAIQQFLAVFLELTSVLSQLAKLPLCGSALTPTADDGSTVGNLMGVMRRYVFGSQKPSLETMPDLQKSLIGRCVLRGLKEEEAPEQGLVLLAAGSDTTSTAAQSILLAIMSDQRVYNKLQDEIEQVDGIVSYPIQWREIMQVPYLRACVLEGLRVHPPLYQLRERVVPPEGDYISGYRVPGGTYVGLNTRGMQRSGIFGDDVEAFRPERWLVDDEIQLKKMTQTVELSFGYGPSKCLGMQIALMKMHKIVFELLRNFDTAIVDPLEPWRQKARGVFSQEDFRVFLAEKRMSEKHRHERRSDQPA